MKKNISEISLQSFLSLKDYVEKENYKGYDPYDGLNSKFFKVLPFRNWRLSKLCWIQLFKLNPINLRSLLGVPKEHNTKGIGLFLNGYCQLLRLSRTGHTFYGSESEILEKINYLAQLLINLQSPGFSGSCWGYNFDWQNRVFFQPQNTPTVVATSFVANSLFEAYEVTNNQSYLDIALSSCNFITKDLNRTVLDKNNFIFSYSPLDNSQVYNASLLGARLLAQGYHYTKKIEYLTTSKAAISTICNLQNSNGSWVYGRKNNQQWIDSFHTGFNLECLSDFAKYTNDESFGESLERGFNFYLNHFFLSDGTPKYYFEKTYPIDIHSPAQLIATLVKTNKLQNNRDLADKVLEFTIKEMQDPKGYFYYQLKPIISSKIPYMRWAQAWMFYAFSLNELAKNS